MGRGPGRAELAHPTQPRAARGGLSAEGRSCRTGATNRACHARPTRDSSPTCPPLPVGGGTRGGGAARSLWHAGSAPARPRGQPHAPAPPARSRASRSAAPRGAQQQHCRHGVPRSHHEHEILGPTLPAPGSGAAGCGAGGRGGPAALPHRRVPERGPGESLTLCREVNGARAPRFSAAFLGSTSPPANGSGQPDASRTRRSNAPSARRHQGAHQGLAAPSHRPKPPGPQSRGHRGGGSPHGSPRAGRRSCLTLPSSAQRRGRSSRTGAPRAPQWQGTGRPLLAWGPGTCPTRVPGLLLPTRPGGSPGAGWGRKEQGARGRLLGGGPPAVTPAPDRPPRRVWAGPMPPGSAGSAQGEEGPGAARALTCTRQ